MFSCVTGGEAGPRGVSVAGWSYGERAERSYGDMFAGAGRSVLGIGRPTSGGGGRRGASGALAPAPGSGSCSPGTWRGVRP